MNEDISSRLNSLLSDPQALGQIMNLVSGMMGTSASQSSDSSRFGASPSPPEPQMPEMSAFEPPLSEPSPPSEPSEPVFAFSKPSQNLPFLSGNDDRCELLRALKPYLRNERAGKIDLMIRVLQLSSLMRNSGLGLFDRH